MNSTEIDAVVTHVTVDRDAADEISEPLPPNFPPNKEAFLFRGVKVTFQLFSMIEAPFKIEAMPLGMLGGVNANVEASNPILNQRLCSLMPRPYPLRHRC